MTHDQSEALSISDRVAIMGNGTVHQVGTPKEIYASPADEFTATFIGSPPLNVFDIRVTGGVSSPIVLPLDGTAEGEFRVGVRPESLILGAGPNEAEATAFEYAGRETIVYLRIGDVEIRAIAHDVSGMAIGQRIRFGVQQSGVHVLSREAG